VAPESPTEANRYRIERLERDVRDLQLKLDDYAALKQNVASLAAAMERLSGEFSALRKALYTAALSVAGSFVLLAVTIALAVLQ
jgi:hypothetical protein